MSNGDSIDSEKEREDRKGTDEQRTPSVSDERESTDLLKEHKSSDEKSQVGRTLYDLAQGFIDRIGPFGRAALLILMLFVAFYWGQGKYRDQLADANARLQAATNESIANLQKLETLRITRFDSIKNELEIMEEVRQKINVLREKNAEFESQRITMTLFKPLIGGIRNDINNVIERVYGPYQIRRAIDRQMALANSSDPSEQRKSLLLAIRYAFSPDASPKLREQVIIGFDKFIQRIIYDMDAMRKELLWPVREIEQQLPTVEVVKLLQRVSEETRGLTLEILAEEDLKHTEEVMHKLISILRQLEGQN